MGIRLNKVLSDLNIGLQTVVAFLNSEGYELRSDITPNSKISDEQYEKVIEHFGGIRLSTKRWRFEVVFSDNPEENRHIIDSHHWNEFKSDTFMFLPSGGILIPANQSVTKYKFWSKEDLIEKCPNAIEGGLVIKNRLSAPTMEIHVAPFRKPQTEISQQKKNIYEIKHDPISPNLNMLGKIDLSSINSSTRPRKKTKEEKKAEREQRVNMTSGKISGPTIKTENNSPQKTNQNFSTIRDIWQRFVDIQEKLIKQRCSPIAIIPESIEVENDKLHVTVDESHSEKIVDTLLKEVLGVNDYDLDSGYILVDEGKWNVLKEAELAKVRKELSGCYIELDTTPEINATIDYSRGMGRSDQMSINEIKQLDLILSKGEYIEGRIDDTVAFISKVSVDREAYMHYLFGDHYVTEEKVINDTIQKQEYIIYKNQYLTWNTLQTYKNLGLNCNKYILSFKVINQNAKEKLKDTFDCYYRDKDQFLVKRVFSKKDPCTETYIQEVKDNIQAFMDEALIYCSVKDIDISVLFYYKVSKHQLVRDKFNEICSVISSLDGYSFNDETGAIGIDFNWREHNISDLIRKFEDSIPFVKINVHDEHRFKCKVECQFVGFNELKESLEDKYEDITIENDSIFHTIKIKLPYIEAESYEPLYSRLYNDLAPLKSYGVMINFAPKVKDKIRLNIKYNEESKLEDLEDNILNMRRADFGFMLDDKEIPFGKLLKVNYPNLTFDIDVADDKKDGIISALKSKAISTIIPILTGDLEKISRLKNTFTMATKGQELINPRLQSFIFDSSLASKTNDVELLLRHDGYVYKDFCGHLLNDKVNESQKQAIIKAMFADDLAVIQGPPGTGKSTAIAELLWQLVRKGQQQVNKKERILLTSETNLAVDNALSRIVNEKSNLVKPIRFGGEEKLESEGLQFSIDLMKRWVEVGDSCLKSDITDEDTDTVVEYNLILKNWLNNISRRSFYGMQDSDNEIIMKWRNYLNKPDKILREIVYKRYVDHANVVGATCSSIGDKRAGSKEFNGFTPFFNNYCEVFKIKNKNAARIEFTTVIQDESSKATPAELVLPFVYGERAIVIGDHRQLPPMLDKEEFEESLDFAVKICKSETEKEEINGLRQFVEDHFDEMEISHFQKLYENIDPSLKGTFNLQYRMHPDINAVIEQFYRNDGGLKCGLTYPIDLGVNDPDITKPTSRYHGICIPGIITPDTHVLFINSTSPEMLDGTSRVNYGEVETIDRLLSYFEMSPSFAEYLSKFEKEEDKQIGVISFYGKQIKQLRAISRLHSNIPIRVSTVDRFQGMERNIVIVSMVRSNLIQSSKNQNPDKKRYPKYGYPFQKSLGFAQSPNRLNVALSRAKRLLIIVGNRELFSELDIYRRLFLTIENNANNKVLNQNEL